MSVILNWLGLRSSHLLSMAMPVFVVAVNCIGVRAQIAFVLDNEIQNCVDDGWGGGFRTQIGVSDIRVVFRRGKTPAGERTGIQTNRGIPGPPDCLLFTMRLRTVGMALVDFGISETYRRPSVPYRTRAYESGPIPLLLA
jgi:hypothetical protein